METASVKVAVRVRPLTSHETGEGCADAVLCQEEHKLVALGSGQHEKTFGYDHVFGQSSGNGPIYNTCVAPLLARALDGYNVTVFAYGQTGSGKTFTMMEGFAEAAAGLETPTMGVAPRLIRDLFSTLSTAGNVVDFAVKVSCLEIYNENVYDLLSKDGIRAAKNVVIRDNEAGDQVVSGLTETKVISTLEMAHVLNRGMGARQTASTGMNHRSSRSHAVFTIIVEQTLAAEDCASGSAEGGGAAAASTGSAPASTGPGYFKRTSRIHLVDLAGSERAKRTGAAGDRLKEGASINKSLLALGNVINALAAQEDAATEAAEGGGGATGRSAAPSHIPYRDSKLTRLLKSSLGGNAYTLMIACASPADSNIEETLSTLRYAARARAIKNKAVINVDPMTQQLAGLRAQVKALAEQLNAARAGLPLGEDYSLSLPPPGSASGTHRLALADVSNVSVSGTAGHAAPCPCGRTLELQCGGGGEGGRGDSGAAAAHAPRLRGEQAVLRKDLFKLSAEKDKLFDRAHSAESDRDDLVWQLQQLAGACKAAVAHASEGGGGGGDVHMSDGSGAAVDVFSGIKTVLATAEAGIASVLANTRASELGEEDEFDDVDWEGLDPFGDGAGGGGAPTASSSAFATDAPKAASTAGFPSMDWASAVNIDDMVMDVAGAPPSLGGGAAAAAAKGVALARHASLHGPSGLPKPNLGVARAAQAAVQRIRKDIEAVSAELKDKQKLLQAYVEAGPDTSAPPADGTTALPTVVVETHKVELERVAAKLNAAVKERDDLQTRLNGLQARLKTMTGKDVGAPHSAAVPIALTIELEATKSALDEKATQVRNLKAKQEEMSRLLAVRTRSEGERQRLEVDVTSLRAHKSSLTKSLKMEQDRARIELRKAQARAAVAVRERDRIQLENVRTQSALEQQQTVLRRHLEEKQRLQKKVKEQDAAMAQLRVANRLHQGLSSATGGAAPAEGVSLAGLLAGMRKGKAAFLLNPANAPVSSSEMFFTLAAGQAASNAAGNKGTPFSTALEAFLGAGVKNKKIAAEYIGADMDDVDGGVGSDDVHPSDATVEDDDGAVAASASAAVGDRIPFDTLLALAECFDSSPSTGLSTGLRALLEGEIAVHVAYRRTASLIQRLGKERAAVVNSKTAAKAGGAGPVAIEQLEREHARFNVRIKEANDLFQALEGQVHAKEDGVGRGGRGAVRGKAWKREIISVSDANNAIQFLLTAFATMGHALETAVGAVTGERARGDQRLEEARTGAARAHAARAEWQAALAGATEELIALRATRASEALAGAPREPALLLLENQLQSVRAQAALDSRSAVLELEASLSRARHEAESARKEAAELRASAVEFKFMTKGGKGRAAVPDEDVLRIVAANRSAAVAGYDVAGTTGEGEPFPRSSGGGKSFKAAKEAFKQPAAGEASSDVWHAGGAEEEGEEEEAFDSAGEEEEDDEDFEDESRSGKKRKRTAGGGKAGNGGAAGKKGNKKPARASVVEGEEDDLMDGVVKGAKRAAGGKAGGDTCKCSGSAKGRSCKNCACHKAGRKCGDTCKCGDSCANPFGAHKAAGFAPDPEGSAAVTVEAPPLPARALLLPSSLLSTRAQASESDIVPFQDEDGDDDMLGGEGPSGGSALHPTVSTVRAAATAAAPEPAAVRAPVAPPVIAPTGPFTVGAMSSLPGRASISGVSSKRPSTSGAAVGAFGSTLTSTGGLPTGRPSWGGVGAPKARAALGAVVSAGVGPAAKRPLGQASANAGASGAASKLGFATTAKAGPVVVGLPADRHASEGGMKAVMSHATSGGAPPAALAPRPPVANLGFGRPSGVGGPPR